jgi:predicted nucleotidyltransferase
MKQDILDKIRLLKKKYEPQGFIVIGVFGSFARGDETEKSDIDILYDCSDALFTKYSGWDFFGFYEDVKADFESELGRKVDLADRKALNRIGEKYILPEVIHVS